MYAYVVAHFNLSHTTASGSQGDGKSDNESDFGEGGEETLLGQGVGEQHGNGSFPSTTGLGKYLPVISHMLMCTCMNTLLSNLDGNESTIGDLVEGSSGINGGSSILSDNLASGNDPLSLSLLLFLPLSLSLSPLLSTFITHWIGARTLCVILHTYTCISIHKCMHTG